jgi:hypothetical protein
LFGKAAATEGGRLSAEKAAGVSSPATLFGKAAATEGGRLSAEKAAGAGPDAGALKLDPVGLDFVAQNYAKTGQMPPMGMGKAGVAVRQQIITRAAQLASGTGPPLVTGTGDLASNRAGYTADTGSLKAIQANLDAVTAFKNTAFKNVDQVYAALDKIPDTGSPVANDFARGVAQKVFGSKEVSNFNTALQVIKPEFARIMSQPGLTGQLTDQAQGDVKAVLGGSFTRAQLRGAIDVLKQDSNNREQMYTQQRDAIKGRIGTGLLAPKAPAAVPAGRIHVLGPNGESGHIDPGDKLLPGWKIG